MYLSMLGNLRLWTVISNESRDSKIGQDEWARHKTKFLGYKLCHSRNINIQLEMYIFFASVYDKACVYEDARVYDNAKVRDCACIFGNARVFDSEKSGKHYELYVNLVR